VKRQVFRAPLTKATGGYQQQRPGERYA
jgi:hypothetical protein